MRKKWQIRLSKPAVKYLLKLPKSIQQKIRQKLDMLQSNKGHLLDIKKLSQSSGGRLGRFRLRVGKRRVIYEVYEDKILILVLDINSRGDIYK